MDAQTREPAATAAPGARLGPGVLLAVIVGLALALRSAQAMRSEYVCPDGVYYIRLAQAFERGDVSAGLGGLHLNVYPLLLLGVHACGISWEVAGKCLGVLCGTLALLPLFGYLVRVHERRLALIGTALVALHPKAIEWSGELVRDSAFWLFFACALYALWRAVSEARLIWHLIGGVALTLAAHTRFEGWFLFVPLGLWTWHAARQQPALRRTLYGGLAVAGIVPVVAVLAVNLIWLRHYGCQDWGNFERLKYVAWWAESSWSAVVGADDAVDSPQVKPSVQVVGADAPSLVSADAPALVNAEAAASSQSGSSPAANLGPPPVSPDWSPRPNIVGQLFEFLRLLGRGMDLLFLGLALLGIRGVLDFLRKWQYYPLFLVCLMVCGGMWVHFWYAQSSSTRYTVTLVMLAAPLAARGVALAADWLSARWPRWTPFGWAAALLTVVLLANFAHRLGPDRTRVREASLGVWLKEHYGAGRKILVAGRTSLVSYYAEAEPLALFPVQNGSAALDFAESEQPDVVVILPGRVSPDCLAFLQVKLPETGWEGVPLERLPAELQGAKVAVYVRESAVDVAGQARSAQAGGFGTR